ncbi:MAG: DUF2156 domain-containing protein [bacterium]|nr:DUF2156 domain-containing protein [bacterium]
MNRPANDNETNARSRNGPEFSGALEGLKVLGVNDLSRYQAAVEAGQQKSWGYYFPFLLTRNRTGRNAILVVEDEGSLCVFNWKRANGIPRLDLAFAPLPLNPAVLRRCIERANEFNGDRSARVMRIDAKDVDAVRETSLRPRESRQQFIFAPKTYEDLGGKAFKTVRRNVALVDRLANVEVLPFSTSHAKDCHALLVNWKKAHREAFGSSGGAGTSRRAINFVGTLPESILRGEVVFVDGRLVAFAFGGEIRPGLACSFERKCDTSIPGLGYFQLRSLFRSFGGVEMINDGTDTGREGLRQLKTSFRPIEMHVEYRARQGSLRRSDR